MIEFDKIWLKQFKMKMAFLQFAIKSLKFQQTISGCDLMQANSNPVIPNFYVP